MRNSRDYTRTWGAPPAAGLGVRALLALLLAVGTLASTPAQAEKVDLSPVLDFAESEQHGHSLLLRNPGGLVVTLSTSDIAPLSAITIWWVVFNNPEACATTPCTVSDLFEPAVEADALGAADGAVVHGERSHYLGKLKVGSTRGSINPLLGNEPVGLLDPYKAEIHLVVRSHGPRIPGQVRDQITSFGGGCAVFLDPPEVPDEEGECADIQFAIHEP